MCHTKTGASIYGLLEALAYILIITAGALLYNDSHKYWGLNHKVYHINGTSYDEETLGLCLLIIGSIGLLCSLVLVIGVGKRCRALMLPWLVWEIVIVAIHAFSAVNMMNVIQLLYSVVMFIIWCCMVSLYRKMDRYERTTPATNIMDYSMPVPYNKITNMV